jgi:hypothetical protein
MEEEIGIKNIKHIPNRETGEKGAFPQFTYEDEPQMIVSPYGKIFNDGGNIKAVSIINPSPVEAIRFYEHILDVLPQGFAGDLDNGVSVRYLINEAGDKAYVAITGCMD